MKPAKNLLITTLILLFTAPSVAFAWGQNGHDAITAIADSNLTPKARTVIDKYLEGRSIIYYASWMDWVRHTPEYKHTNGWHGATVDNSNNYTSEVAREGGDAVSAIEASIKALQKYQSLPAETVAFHIKILVHAVGDYHCPVHVKYSDLKTSFSIFVNGKKVTHHSVWDGNAVDNRKWGYMEWAHQMNRLPPEKIAKITAGTPRDWFRETALDSRVIYDWAKPDEKFEGTKLRDFLNKATPYAESQIQKAGYRLARVLNDIFGQ